MTKEKKKKELFTHPRWHEPIGGKTIGKIEFTEEEKEENKRKLDVAMKKFKAQAEKS